MTDLWRLSATDLAARVRARRVSAAEVARDALARLDAANPAVNAVVAHDPGQTLAEAAAVDAALARGGDPGPMAGVPVTVKVNTDQKGWATTNGLRTQRGLVAEHDNPVVANLRRAGAVVLGRTNTPAFSLRWFTRNGLHGHTRNPRDPSITPGRAATAGTAPREFGFGGRTTLVGRESRGLHNRTPLMEFAMSGDVPPQKAPPLRPPGFLGTADRKRGCHPPPRTAAKRVHLADSRTPPHDAAPIAAGRAPQSPARTFPSTSRYATCPARRPSW